MLICWSPEKAPIGVPPKDKLPEGDIEMLGARVAVPDNATVTGAPGVETRFKVAFFMPDEPGAKRT